MKTETIILDEAMNVTLTTYLQSVGGDFPNIPARPAVIVIPGGGYDYCSDREAEPIAFTYLKAGYQVFILRYSVRENKRWPKPLEDYEQAISMIRARAKEWKVIPDKIAVVGFSAGGHLAASAATMSVNRPNAAILVYAVLDEASAKEWNDTAPDAVAAVDEKTCPCFLAASRTDTMVPAQNTLRFTQALYEYDISFESHVYSFAPHGFSLGDSTVQAPGVDYTPRVHHWVDESLGWLTEVFGDFGPGCLTEPKFGHYAILSHEDHLSTRSTLGQIKASPAGRAFLDSMMGAMNAAADSKQDKGMAIKESVLDRMKLSDLLTFAGLSAEAIAEIDKKLAE